MPSSDSSGLSSSIVKIAAGLLDRGSTAVLVTLIQAPANVGAKLLIDSNENTFGSLGNDSLDQAAILQSSLFLDSKQETQSLLASEFAPTLTELRDVQVLFERLQPEARIVICGAGHVGAALAKLAAVMGYRSTVIDDRVEFLRRERFPDARIELVTAANWTDAVLESIGNGPGVSVAVVTRGHAEDEACLQAVMKANPDYTGLIGSKRRTNIVLQRLHASGVDEDRLRRVHAPIGLDIGAVTPEEVALAIMAEIVAVRRGGGGRSLSSRKVR